MKTKHYAHLSITEREKISIFKAQGLSLRDIGKALNRDPATILRELRRNAPPVHQGYYLGHKAHERAGKRKSNAHSRKRLKDDSIRRYVEEKLILRWSPEQIAGRMGHDHPGCSISHEAIYQYLYQHRYELISYLPRAHRKRQKRGHSRKHRTPHIPNRVSIDQRPAYIEKRRQIGHWELDTMISRQSIAALVVSVERKSRFTTIAKLERKTALAITHTLTRRLLSFPQQLRRTLTYDNGSENTDHETINQLLGTQSYFCNPYHSWEKATVENTVGLIRRFFPKKTDFAHVDTWAIESVEFLLNTRPRKCLNYLTPIEVLSKECCT